MSTTTTRKRSPRSSAPAADKATATKATTRKRTAPKAEAPKVEEPKVERTLASSDAEVTKWVTRKVAAATKDGGKRPGVAALLAQYRGEGRKCSQERFRTLASAVK